MNKTAFRPTRFALLLGCGLLFSVAAAAQKKKQAVRYTVPTIDTSTSVDEAFTRVEVEAEFPGGSAAWADYLRANLNVDKAALRGIPAGTYIVRVQFLVGRNGAISEVKALDNPGYGLAQEAVRVIRKGPKWTPAMQNGRQVKAYRTQPIGFVYSD